MRTKSLLSLLCVAALFIASSGGQNQNRAGAPNDVSDCGGCHGGGGAATGNIEIAGIPAEYVPGETYSMSITVNEPNAGAALSAAGFQVVATNAITNQMLGSFTITDAGTRLTPSPNNRLVQNSPRDFTGNAATWDFDWTAPPSSNFPDEITFFFSGNSVNENGSFFGDIPYFNASSVQVVPVTWTHINVSNINGRNILNWGTATEQNNSHFVVEHSINGEDFRQIAEIEGAGESLIPQDYELVHENNLATNNYYRVKQVDFNGKYEYSDVVLAKTSDKEILVYPTQVVDRINIKGLESNDLIQIYSMSGNLIYETISKDMLLLDEINSGMYVLIVNNKFGEIISTTRIVKT